MLRPVHIPDGREECRCAAKKREVLGQPVRADRNRPAVQLIVNRDEGCARGLNSPAVLARFFDRERPSSGVDRLNPSRFQRTREPDTTQGHRCRTIIASLVEINHVRLEAKRFKPMQRNHLSNGSVNALA